MRFCEQHVAHQPILREFYCPAGEPWAEELKKAGAWLDAPHPDNPNYTCREINTHYFRGGGARITATYKFREPDAPVVVEGMPA